MIRVFGNCRSLVIWGIWIILGVKKIESFNYFIIDLLVKGFEEGLE